VNVFGAWRINSVDLFIFLGGSVWGALDNVIQGVCRDYYNYMEIIVRR